MTAIAVLPVAATWLASQGPYSYFFPRYLLLTVGAWAVMAGIALSRLDLKIAAAGLAMIAILGAGDQQVIRAPGAHDWSIYPVGRGGSYHGYAQAAQVVAGQVRPGDRERDRNRRQGGQGHPGLGPELAPGQPDHRSTSSAGRPPGAAPGPLLM